MIGLLRNLVSTAALVPWTRVMRTFHLSIHEAFVGIAERLTQLIFWDPKSFTGSFRRLESGLPWKNVRRPNGFWLDARASSVGSPLALTFSRIGTASLRRTRMSYASRRRATAGPVGCPPQIVRTSHGP